MNIQIKCRLTAKVLFECEAASMKIAVEKAIEAKANLSEANLSEANLSEANLSEANLSWANLSKANLSEANLSEANLSEANLSEVKKDFYSVIENLPSEVPGLYMALLDGHVDGSTYNGECACLVGTLANVKGCKPEMLRDFGVEMRASRAAEKWFMGIKKGDSPENNQVSRIVKEWVIEFCKEKEIKLPTRNVVWK